MKCASFITIRLMSICLLLTPAIDAVAQKAPVKEDTAKVKDPMQSGTFSVLKFRSIGPCLMSGRISSIAVNPQDHSNYYIAAASGGVWKTTNRGTTWEPMFDGEGSYSIGCVVIDPNNPLVLWVGTGENNSQRSVGYGDGVYRSDDAGKTWKNMGLKKSEHIARIIIDPRNSNVVYVASQGPLWGPGGERGLYKSTDGGKTWNCVLSISENTGVTDIVMDHKNPDILYAASYQRRRHVWTLINGGPESALHKSTDAGLTWNKIKNGLPGVEIGRIGLAISPINNRVIYAVVEAAQGKGGFFRSVDAGANWEKRADYVSGSPQYYQTIYADPFDVDRVYSMDVFLMVSDDGGKTFTRLGERSKHVDNHAMWIDPSDGRHYLVGSDGGLYESFDRGQTWNFKPNLPITQFYDVTVDNSYPFYYIYGGTQDNSTLGGPSRTRNASGIMNSDWFITTGGDGFQSRVDPEDPNIVYSESQYGYLVRYDRRTGEEIGIQPQPAKGEMSLRWNWDSPLIISPHKHTRLYFAANRLFRSEDRGDSWQPISGDLTRQIDRNQLEVMGKIWSVDAVAKNASTSLYGNCVALSESPLKEGLLYVGTDDGLIHVTEDGGRNWRKIEKFPGIPDRTYVTRIIASRHDVNVLYASFDNHKMADFAPYLLQSTDAGKTWKSIAGNLPANGPVLAVAEDHVKPDLLFVGTEFGAFFTLDGGKKWIQFKSGLPVISVRDIAIQKRENDLVLATFGRGFYVLDDYSPLRSVSKEPFDSNMIFPSRDAMMFVEATPLGGGRKATQGESFYTAQNPPVGATFTYYIKEALKTKKELRQEAEKEAEKKKQPIKYPTWDELKAEDEEEAPFHLLVITDSDGKTVRQLSAPSGKGLFRTTWDLKYPRPILGSAASTGSDYEPGGGSYVIPGKYGVTLYNNVNGILTKLAGPQMFNVVVPGQIATTVRDRTTLAEFQQKVSRLQRAMYGTIQVSNDIKNRLGMIKRAIQETTSPVEGLKAEALSIEKRLNDIIRNLRGDATRSSRNENSYPSIGDRVYQISGDQSGSTSKPTQTHRDGYAIAAEEFTVEHQKLRNLMEVDFKALENAIETAGSPWTPGRLPDWKPER